MIVGEYLTAFWITAKVVVLLKSFEKERTHFRSYRARSLLPALGKVLERIMGQRLEVKPSAMSSERQLPS